MKPTTHTPSTQRQMHPRNVLSRVRVSPHIDGNSFPLECGDVDVTLHALQGLQQALDTHPG